MALLKQKALPNGTSGEYWKIISTPKSSKQTMKITIDIHLFKDHTFAVNGNLKPMGYVKSFLLPVTLLEMSEDQFELGYAKIKSVMNEVRVEAIAHQDAIPEIQADPENNVEYRAAVPEVLARPAVYKYPDLAGAVDA